MSGAEKGHNDEVEAIISRIIKKTKRLCELDWFNNDNTYRKIYEIIATEGRLPEPCNVRVIPNDAVTEPEEGGKNVLGFAIRYFNIVWFKHDPPEYDVFAHELIHLAKKNSKVDEEFYAYNLSSFIVFLAKNNIIPKVNPLRLFEDVELKDLARVICDVTSLECDDNPRNTIKEFFKLIGVIPIVYFDVKRALEDDSISFDFRPSLSDKDIAINTISEILWAVDFDSTARDMALKLLNSLEARNT